MKDASVVKRLDAVSDDEVEIEAPESDFRFQLMTRMVFIMTA